MEAEEYPITWKKDKKPIEYRSLNAAKSKLRFLKSLTDVSSPNQENPDFVFIDNVNHRIGIEHFCIDISMGSRKNSGTRISQSTIRQIYEKYHGNIISRENSAIFDMETMLNRLVKDWQNFKYQTFCNNFKRVFDDHYLKIEKYKAESRLTNIGFLIEFLVPNSVYKISSNGEPLHLQELHDFPLTSELWQLLHRSLNNLDFIIIDTNQFTKNKDNILWIDKETSPKKLIKEFAPPLKGENGKAKLRLAN